MPSIQTLDGLRSHLCRDEFLNKLKIPAAREFPGTSSKDLWVRILSLALFTVEITINIFDTS